MAAPLLNSARNLVLGDPVDLIPIESVLIDRSRRLGTGGAGVVFAGELTGIPVAVKFFAACDEEEALKRVEREVQIQQRVRDPRVLAVFGWARLYHPDLPDGTPRSTAIVMELAPAGSLASLINSGGGFAAFPLTARLKLLWQVAAVLTRLHSGNINVHPAEEREEGFGTPAVSRRGLAEAGVIVHGDLKPANILLSSDGAGGYFPKLADFGLSTVRGAQSGDTLVGPNRGQGTAAYQCPSLRDGLPYVAQTDVYALGIVVWETLLGEVPYADFKEEVQAGLPRGHVPSHAWNYRLLEAVRGAQLRPDAERMAAVCRAQGLPEVGVAELVRLVRACWEPSLEARIPAGVVADRLREVMLLLPHMHAYGARDGAADLHM